jgi:hypothetical protein
MRQYLYLILREYLCYTYCICCSAISLNRSSVLSMNLKTKLFTGACLPPQKMLLMFLLLIICQTLHKKFFIPVFVIELLDIYVFNLSILWCWRSCILQQSRCRPHRAPQNPGQGNADILFLDANEGDITSVFRTKMHFMLENARAYKRVKVKNKDFSLQISYFSITIYRYIIYANLFTKDT